jgi:hypothetical protein
VVEGPGRILPTLWRPPAGATPDTGNYIYLASDTGDFIGAGDTVLDRPPDDVISAQSSTGHLVFSILAMGVPGDRGVFYTMSSIARFEVGYYFVPPGTPLDDTGKASLDWILDGHGCTTVTGWFTVDHVDYSGDTLTGVDLRFEQQCDGSSAALRGAVHWRE